MSDKETLKELSDELGSVIGELEQTLVEGQDEMAVAADEATETLDRIDSELEKETLNIKSALSEKAAEEVKKNLSH